MARIIMQTIEENAQYRAEDGTSLAREYGRLPNGEPNRGLWVLRDAAGRFVDYDQYRHDIECRRNLTLIG